jgi:hypothetical protein
VARPGRRRRHCESGASAWHCASTYDGNDPDAVLACAGGIPTVETLAAADMLRRDLPEARVRVVNIVDLYALATPEHHPHGLHDTDFADLFGQDTPIVVAFHGYPPAVHQLLHARADSDRFHVRGYIEKGTTTPHDLLVSNGVSRHDLAVPALRHLRGRPAATGDPAAPYVHRRDEIHVNCAAPAPTRPRSPNGPGGHRAWRSLVRVHQSSRPAQFGALPLARSAPDAVCLAAVHRPVQALSDDGAVEADALGGEFLP